MKKKNRLLRLSLIVAILAFLGTGSLPAATITFVGSGADWNTAGNWSPAQVPTTSDDVIIPTGFNVTTSGAVNARTISIYGNSTLTITQATNIATTATGGITLNGTSSLIINAAVAVNIGNATYRGDIVQNDNSNITFSTAAATVTLSGTWTVATNATITNTTAPDLSVVGATAVTLPSTLTSLNSLTVNKPGSTCTLSDDLTTTTSLGISAGTLIVGNNDLTVTTTTSIALGATLNAASTATNTRTFSGIITLNGTLISSGGSVTNIFTSALSIPATGVLTINNSTSDFGGTVAGVASGATINAYGATVSFTGAVTFTNLTLNTNSNTNLTFNAAQTAGNQIPALTVHNLTFANDAALAGNVTVYGNFTNTATYTTDVNAFTFTVYGTFNNPTGAFFDAVGSTVKLYGPVTSWGTDETEFITNNTTTLEILGSGSLPANFTIAANNNFGNFTLNRPGATFTVSGNYVVGFNTLTITSGTVVLPDEAHSVTTTTTIGANGVLDLSAVTTANNGITFTTGLAGSGQIIANGGNGAGEPVITIAAGCNYTFTGDILTNQYTILRISSTQTSDIELPSSITQLSSLIINRGNVARKVILNSNLTITDNISALVFASGRFELNGKTITFSGTYVPNTSANFIMDATEGSTVVFNGAPTFAANGLITDETTNFQMGAAATIHSTITTLNNLTITTGTTALGGDLTLYGNLSVASGATLNKATFNLTVYGDVSNLGTLTLSGASGTITLYGQMIGSGTYTTGTSTVLSIQGTSSQFILPAGITTLGRLTLNRPAGMKIMAGLTVGDGAGGNNDITITLGDLDLNGFNVTLANANAQISETAGNTFINTGLSTSGTGYVTTASSTAAEIASSGIGVTSISGPTGITVRRYPRTVPIAGVGLATHRIYYITGTGSVTAVTLAFDNTELYSNAADLKLYHTTDYTFVTSPTEVSGTVTENTPVTGVGQLAVTGVSIATANYYALAAAPGAGGVLRTFVGTSGNWGDPNSWSPTGVPSKVDQVVIGPATVTVNGNGAIYECKTLVLNHQNATVQPANNTVNGDVVSLRVMGNITLTAGSEILGANGTGRLNLIIGDGTTAGVSSTISVNNDYTTGSGLWVHNLTVNAADVTGSANRIRVSGDVALLANSAVSGVNAEFWGGYDALQTISVPVSAFLSFTTIRTDNNANVSTQSNITVTDKFEILTGSTFNATGGTTYFTTPVSGSGDPWSVQNGGTLQLFNVELNSSAGAQTFVPLGTAYIQGNFYQYGTDAFAPTSGRVIFSNLGQREIVNTQNDDDLVFYALEVTSGSKVVTSSNFQVQNEINVVGNGSLKANNGTITFTGNGNIYNASNQTLEFNDLTIIGLVNTSDSWKIKGNLVVSGSLLADGGTITFENIQEKSINASGTLRFFKLKVANGSKLTTATNHNFTIRNNATNPLGAGIEVEGNGEFYVGSASSVVTFDVGTGVSAGNPKTIVKSDAGRLDFGTITIAANPNNEVATASDFKITGTGASTFVNSGAGGKFTATAGTITFTGAAPQISSISPASTQFYSIRTEGATALTVPNQAQELYVAGDLTINGTSSMDFATPNTASRIIFNGSTLQKITGNTTAITPIQFADLTLNKSGNSELLLELDATIASSASHELVLTNGILNLGSRTFTVGAGAISRLNGAINGGTGTYVVTTNHVTPLLEDAYFTVSGVPTLYNLTINAAHTTANDLTVNGTLDLATANLTIGTGASAVNPMKLILNGNLTRTTGLLAGSLTNSRLVLQGTGTVTNGLSNSYFVGTAATTVQLEVARQETLGGNLNIANTSYLRINTGINDFDLGSYTLTFNTSFNVVMISGGIKAGTGSAVVLPNIANLTIPPTMFRNNEVNNLTIANTLNLAGDLRINGTLTGAYNITTNDNVLTFGPSATLPAFSSTAYVIGNLRRYVKNTNTKFDVGIGGQYIPVVIRFANSSSQQAVVVKPNYVNPTLGKGGDPTRALLAMWNITAEGTALNDSLRVNFEWPNTIHNSLTPASGTTFAAKWLGTSWYDYRNNASYSSQVLSMTGFPVKGSSALTGEWGIFVATANTDAAKDAAIKVTGNKLVITKIEPLPIVVNQAFSVTVQLQNEYGQAVNVSTPFNFTIKEQKGSGGFANVSGVIPAGQSYVTLNGLSITAAGGNYQLRVDSAAASEVLSGVSQLFDVLPTLPTSQATALTFTNITATTATISWSNGGGTARIVLIKPDTLLKLTEYPQNGETYYGNSIVGLGSSIGGATVLYNGTSNSINIVGLAPNTKYYVYVFEYNGTDGNENYRTIAASGNPKSFETTGSYDDDVTFGTNNTRALSKGIGTNTPIRGTIKSSTDEDWFNFNVASTTPNVRVKLTNLAGDYTLEFYDTTGRRIRRSTLSGKSSEAAVINGLPAGTYTVRIFSTDGTYWTKSGEEYILQVSTYGSEIYSVTP